MNKMGLKILLLHGHYIVCEVTEQEFFAYKAAWKQTAKTGNEAFLEGTALIDGAPWSWCICTRDIVGMHTVILSPGGGMPVPTPQGQRRMPFAPPGVRISGV